MERKAPTIIDLNAETAKLTLFRGRTAATSFAERKGSTVILGPYRDGFLLLSKFTGNAHWETHPEDEWFYILDGAMTVDVAERDGPRSRVLEAGTVAVLPRNSWHRVVSTEGVTAFSATLPSDHVDRDDADPRPFLPPGWAENRSPSAVTSAVDLVAELAKLTMFRRSPGSTAAERGGSVAQLCSYRDGLVLAIKASGKDHWERHLTGDELVCIIDGAATADIVCDDRPPQSFALAAGTVAVIPQGAWHRFRSPEGFTQLTVTPFPGETVIEDVDDPRTAKSAPA